MLKHTDGSIISAFSKQDRRERRLDLEPARNP
jgi:hypothetical protein